MDICLFLLQTPQTTKTKEWNCTVWYLGLQHMIITKQFSVQFFSKWSLVFVRRGYLLLAGRPRFQFFMLHCEASFFWRIVLLLPSLTHSDWQDLSFRLTQLHWDIWFLVVSLQNFMGRLLLVMQWAHFKYKPYV